MPRKPRNLAILENSPVSTNPPDNTPPITKETTPTPVAPIAKETMEDDTAPLQAVKPKRPQTEAQKAATAKMRAKLAEKNEKARLEKAAAAEEYKKQVEERVVKKALAIKKKQIKQQMALDEISSDDEPLEEIIPKIRKAVARQPTLAPPKPTGPKIIFM